jgi:hypothetical protein
MESIGHYRAYMLRMWSVEQSGQAEWRASLEDPHTGERLGFSNVEALMVYLCELTGSSQNEEDRLRDNEPRA